MRIIYPFTTVADERKNALRRHPAFLGSPTSLGNGAKKVGVTLSNWAMEFLLSLIGKTWTTGMFCWYYVTN